MIRERVIIKKKGSFFGRLLLFLFAFILGAVGSLGAVVGVGYYLSTKKTVKEVFDYTGLDYSAYVTEEYAQKTVFNAIKDAYTDAQALTGEDACIDDLNKISPMVGKQAEAMAKALYESYGIQLNKDGELMTVPFVKLGEHFNKALDETPVLDIVKHFGEGNKIIEALCYGIEGEDYIYDADGNRQFLEGHHPMTIGEFASIDLHDRIDRLPIDLLVDIDPDDAMMRSIAYGHEHRYQFVTVDGEKAIEMRQAYYLFIDGKFYDDYKKELACTFEQIDATDYILTFENKKEYVSNDGTGKFMVYKAIETETGYLKGDKVSFPKITMKELQGDSETVINNIPLGQALHVDKNSHPVLIALAYGEEGKDFVYDGDKVVLLHDARTIGDFRNENVDMLNDIYLSTLIDVDTDNSIVMYLLYGKENLHYQLDGDKVVPLQKKVAIYGGKVYNEYGEEMVNATPISGGYQVVEDGTTTVYKTTSSGFVAGEKTQVEINGTSVPLYHVCDESGNAILYKATTVGDLSGENSALNNLTSRMVLSDIIEVSDDDTILKHIADTPVDKIPEAINNLTIGEVFDKDIYYTNANGDYTDKDGNVVSEANKVMQPMWKYMLTPEGEASPKLDYKLTSDINKMTENVQANIQSKTLNELANDGIIQDANTTAFSKAIPEYIYSLPGYESYQGKVLGDLNIHGLIDLMTYYTQLW